MTSLDCARPLRVFAWLCVFAFATAPYPGIAKTASKSGSANVDSAYQRDLQRDKRTLATTNPRDRTVHRYTTKERAAKEAKSGIPGGSHMTAEGRRGRPLGPQEAEKKYGLKPGQAQVRETIRLPKGQPLKHNKTTGGKAGVGEITSPNRIPPSQITNTVPLKQKR
jgi:hypothetical protein